VNATDSRSWHRLCRSCTGATRCPFIGLASTYSFATAHKLICENTVLDEDLHRWCRSSFFLSSGLVLAWFDVGLLIDLPSAFLTDLSFPQRPGRGRRVGCPRLAIQARTSLSRRVISRRSPAQGSPSRRLASMTRLHQASNPITESLEAARYVPAQARSHCRYPWPSRRVSGTQDHRGITAGSEHSCDRVITRASLPASKPCAWLRRRSCHDELIRLVRVLIGHLRGRSAMRASRPRMTWPRAMSARAA
jgi:hypothetical protein